MELGYVGVADIVRKLGPDKAEEILDGIDRVDVIVIGREYWLRYFDIKTRRWRTKDGSVVNESFLIERIKDEDQIDW